MTNLLFHLKKLSIQDSRFLTEFGWSEILLVSSFKVFCVIKKYSGFFLHLPDRWRPLDGATHSFEISLSGFSYWASVLTTVTRSFSIGHQF